MTKPSAERVKLKELVEFVSGFAFKSEKFNKDGKGIPLVRIRDVTRGYSETYFDGSYDERFVVKDDDYLIGMDGEFNLSKWNGGRALLNQRVCKIGKVSEKLDRHYLARFLPGALKTIEDSTPFVTVKHLSVTDLADIQIPIPPIEEQKRIADILDKAESLRAKRREAITLLNSLTQSIFLEMFGDPVSNPKKWEKCALPDACTLYSGGTPSKANPSLWDGKMPWFSPKDLKKTDLFDSIDHISEDVPKLTNLRLLPADTVVIVVRGMILAHTFPVCVLRVPATINQDMKALLPKSNINAQFLATCLRVQSKHALAQVADSAHGTKRIDAEGLRQISIILPPAEQQEIFVKRAESVQNLFANNTNFLLKTEDLFSSIQQRAFSD